MTTSQKENYNNMVIALRNITNFQSPEYLQKHSQRDWYLEYEEALEMSYDNMQTMAKSTVKGIKLIK